MKLKRLYLPQWVFEQIAVNNCFVLHSRPKESFLEIIRYFPLVYWMRGSIDRYEEKKNNNADETKFKIHPLLTLKQKTGRLN